MSEKISHFMSKRQLPHFLTDNTAAFLENRASFAAVLFYNQTNFRSFTDG